jgi:predicted Zn-dependent protease
MIRRGGLAIAVLALALSAASLQALVRRHSSPKLQGVYQDVRDSAAADTVLVDIQHEHYLMIGIVGSSLDDLPVVRKRSAAHDIAGRAYRRYPSPSALRFVVVALVDQGRRLFVFPERQIRDSFQFAVADLDPPALPLTEGWERPPVPPPNDTYLVAVGEVPSSRMSSLAADAEALLAMRVSVLPRLSVNPAMLDAKRSQLTAEEVLLAVRRRHPTLSRDPRTRVIAVTAQDMDIKRRASWRFALSLRSNENTIAVVSYARMDPGNLGSTPDEELLRSRLRKMIFKNIGIMCYGLPVSRDPKSVLYGHVLSLGDLDDMSEFFEPV